MDDYADKISLWYKSTPVCADDDQSQIEWLQSHATPAVLHRSISQWNWDWGTNVLEWMLKQPNASVSAASKQLVYFVGGGALRYGGPEIDMMAQVAARLRSKFYKHRWSLEYQEITSSDKALYFKGLEGIQKRDRWLIPDEAFGPFTGTAPACKYEFDDDGRLRVAFKV